MCESSHPGQLPDKVLQGIFEQLFEDELGWMQNAKTLYQCHLVNKKWSKSAETVQLKLFKNANLPPNDIASFASTVKASQKLADIVTNVMFYPEAPQRNARFPPNANQNLSVILECCPNIEIFVSPLFIEFETFFTWNCLLESKAELKHLKMFSFLDNWTTAEKLTYRLLSLKHKESLIKLVLFPYDSSYDASKDDDFCALKTNLKHFKSLEQLQIRGSLVFSSIVGEMDQMLDDCPQTTHLLQLIECGFSSNHAYPEKVVPNFHIKRLELVDPKLPVCSIKYFETKLKGLKDLVLSVWLSDCYQSLCQSNEWWDQLTSMCKNLDHYNISVQDFSSDNYLHLIKCGIDLTNTIANQKSADFTEFIIDFGQSRSYIIELKQNGSYLGLFKSKFINQFIDKADFQKIVDTLKEYSPKSITILNVERLHRTPFDIFGNNKIGSYLTREHLDVFFDSNRYPETKGCKYASNRKFDGTTENENSQYTYSSCKELLNMTVQGVKMFPRPN
ncbi:hypothetical protein BD408DRAFT_428790 [Parasitella parasitica]|nr:hypothetical protein BD408DRAFT_428790 [Parasitella parasitica]